MALWQDTLNKVQPGWDTPPSSGQPTSSWTRLAQAGAAKTQKLNLMQQAMQAGKQVGKYGMVGLKQAGKMYGHALGDEGTFAKDQVNQAVVQPIKDLTKPFRQKTGNGDNASQIMKLQSNAQTAYKSGQLSQKTASMLKDAPASSRLQAMKMVGKSSDAQIQQFLAKQTQAETKAKTSRTGAAANLLSLAAGGGEAKAGYEAGKAAAETGAKTVLKSALKSGMHTAIPGAMQQGASGIERRGNVNPKQTAKDLAAGAAGGFILGTAGSVAGRVIGRGLELLRKAPVDTTAHVPADTSPNLKELGTGKLPKSLPSAERRLLPEGKIKGEASPVKGGESYQPPVKITDASNSASVKIPDYQTKERGFTIAAKPGRSGSSVSVADRVANAKQIALDHIDRTLQKVDSGTLNMSKEDRVAIFKARQALVADKIKPSEVLPDSHPAKAEAVAVEKLPSTSAKISRQSLKEAATPKSDSPSITAQKFTDTAKKDISVSDLSKANGSAAKLQPDLPKPARSPSNESGMVDPGAISRDMQKAKAAVNAHLAQDKKATAFSGEVSHDANIHEAVNKFRLKQSADLMNKLKDVPKEDKQAVYDFREARAAGTKLPTLTDNQKALHQTITDIVRQANDKKAQLVEMKAPGYTKDKIFDPESGNHRIALGKGSGIEQFLHGNQKMPFSARSLRTTTSSGKARVFYSATDEAGNRSVVAVKNASVKEGLRTVSKGKFITAIDGQGNRTELGKITPQQLKDGSFTGQDGKAYTIGQATSDEISKATGQKYIKDPLTSAIIDYHETSAAVDSARMLEKWKSNPEFENIAMKHGDGVPPKNWRPTSLPQFSGYSFEPKVAHVLDDIHGNIKDGVKALSMANHVLRSTMVAIPLRHNLNEIGFYFTDRGASSLINPMAYKRGTAALIKATNEVMHQGPLYREIVGHGFNFMDQNDKAFSDAITQQTKSMLFDDQNAAGKVASDLGTTVVKLRQAWNTIQHKGVWFQQDVLNMSRIIERMDKGMSVDEAVRQTQRFNPQYRVPSQIAGSRGAAQVLKNNNVLFFGSYHYDQWKVLANMVGDLAGRNGSRAALESVDKFGALALGVYATHALVDKGLQNFSGNKNASTKPFGVLDLPDQLYQVVTGKKDVGSLIQSQIFPSAGLNIIAQLFNNRDFFTGKQIRDTSMPASYQKDQLANWVNSQMPWTQQIKSARSGGSAASAVLSIAGAKFPSNSPATTKLESLKFDSLPNVQSQAKKQAQSGDISGAEATINQYDRLLLAAAKDALKTAGKPVPSDGELIKSLMKQQYYYKPKTSTIQQWSKTRPYNILNRL